MKETIVLESQDDVTNNEADLGENNATMSITADIEDAENNSKVEEESFDIPEKLKGKSAEEIAKIYVDLEKKLAEKKPDGEASEETVVEDSEEEGNTDEQASDDESEFEGEIDESKTADSVAGFQDLWAEQGGKLSDDQWTKVQEMTGMELSELKSWEEYHLQKIHQTVHDHDSTVIEAAGGEQKYNEMLDWAEANFNQEEIDTLNTYLDDPKFYNKGLTLLKSQYESNVGKEASVTVGEQANTTAVEEGAFMSEQDVNFAMTDPRYGTDPQYEREFDKKLLSYMKRTGQLPK